MLTFLSIFFPIVLAGGGFALERFERQLHDEKVNER
jgi:hypothetical protein